MGNFLIAAFISGLSIGGLAAHQFDKVEIMRLEATLSRANAQAEQALLKAQADTAAAEAKADQLNWTLDEEHETNLAKIAELSKRISAAGRAYESGRVCADNTHRTNAVPVREDPGQPEADAGRADFPERLAAIVRRADETAVYAQTCWRFVNSNCGIAGANHGQ